MAFDEKAYRKAYYEANKEKIIARMAEWKRNNPDKMKEHGKAYRARNKERIADSSKAYHEANRDAINVKARLRYAADIDRQRGRSKQYRATNKEKRKATCANYRQRNREAIAMWDKNYNAANKCRHSARARERTEKLPDSLIRNRLIGKGWKVVPQQLIEVKRLQILIKRELKTAKGNTNEKRN